MNIDIIQKIISAEELKKNSALSLDRNGLLEYLLAEGILLMIDWKGEEQETEISDFFVSRLGTLGINSTIDTISTYKKLHTEIDKNSLQPGDAIPYLLKEFQKQLKSMKIAIIALDMGNDSYYIGLARQEDIKTITKPSRTFWQFKAWGSKTGQVLYTVNCSCGSMNIWQLKRGELLTDDSCQDCGKELFDKLGNSSLPVIKEYI